MRDGMDGTVGRFILGGWVAPRKRVFARLRVATTKISPRFL
jgi:hypothetical protein